MTRTRLAGLAVLVVAIAGELRLPIRYIGVGETVGDLEPFDSETFVRALFEV